MKILLLENDDFGATSYNGKPENGYYIGAFLYKQMKILHY